MKGESSKENSIKDKLDLVKQENSELCLQLELEAAKVQQLESDIQAEKKTCLLMEEKLENKCLEFENLNKQLKDHKVGFHFLFALTFTIC